MTTEDLPEHSLHPVSTDRSSHLAGDRHPESGDGLVGAGTLARQADDQIMTGVDPTPVTLGPKEVRASSDPVTLGEALILLGATVTHYLR